MTSLWDRGPRRLLKRLAPAWGRRLFNRLKLASARRRELARIVRADAEASTRTVTYLTDFGLANRMRAHLIAADFAHRTGRELVVRWAENSQCASRFDDLFVRGDAPRSAAGRHVLVRYDRVTDAASHDLQTDLTADVVVLDLGWQAISREPFERRLAGGCEAARQVLAPRDEILTEVQAAAAAWPPTVIGVHIRRGDFATRAGQALSLERYIQAIHEVLRQPGLGEALIFVASDGGDDELRPLLDRWGDRLWRRPPSPRDEARGVQQALVDLLLLSRTQHLVLTPRSTFGEMAAFLGKVPSTLA